MGTYWRWSNLTKRIHLEPHADKLPCDDSTLEMLNDLAHGDWYDDIVILSFDEDDSGFFFMAWPVIKAPPGRSPWRGPSPRAYFEGLVNAPVGLVPWMTHALLDEVNDRLAAIDRGAASYE